MDYDEIARTSFDELPPELNLPNGKYILKARNAAFVPPKEGDTSNAKVLVFFTPTEPVEVDEDALAELGEGYDITNNEVTKTFWIERNRDWRPVMEFLDKLGVDYKGSGKAIPLVLKEDVKGHSIVADLELRSFQRKDGTTVEASDPTAFYAVE